VSDLRRHRRTAKRSYLPQRDRPVLPEAGDRHIKQGLDRVNVLLKVLHADEALVLGLGIDPEVFLVDPFDRQERLLLATIGCGANKGPRMK